MSILSLVKSTDVLENSPSFKEAVSKTKCVHKAMCRNGTEKNRDRHMSMKDNPRKAV